MKNRHAITNIRFTLFSCRDLNPDHLEDLLYSHGDNITYLAALNNESARQKAEWEDECEMAVVHWQEFDSVNPGHTVPFPIFKDFVPNLDTFDPDIDEPCFVGQHEGVHYRTLWLGGAHMLLVLESPLIGHYRLCSPCMPGACDGGEPLSVLEGGEMGFDLPPHWMAGWADTAMTPTERLAAMKE